MTKPETRSIRPVPLFTAVALGGGLLLGCGPEQADADVEVAKGEIIGGTTLSNTTITAQGLLQVNIGCSGSLIDQSTALVATHCADLYAPSSNVARAIGSDNQFKFRDVVNVMQVGTTDITILKFGGAVPTNWPNVSKPILTTSPANLVGQNITCYGQGNTGYAPGGGFTGGFGTWKSLTKPISRYEAASNILVIEAPNGQDIVAPFDSGGTCMIGSQVAGVVWKGRMDCSNQSTSETCKSTATRVYEGHLSAVGKYWAYIEGARTRTQAHFRPLTLENGWRASEYETMTAGVAKVGNTIHLRGAVAFGSTAQITTLLPEYRPASRVYVPITLFGAAKGRLTIETSGTVQVSSESGSFSPAQMFTSLEGVSFARTTQVSTLATMLNGWTGGVYGAGQVRATDDGGVIRLQGGMYTTGSNPLAFNLHSSFRPTKRLYIPVDMYGGSKGRLIIETNGDVYAYHETNQVNAYGFTSLDGVAYSRDASGGTQVHIANGWSTYYDSFTPAVKNSGGKVTLIGAMRTSGTNMQAFLLPERFRPSTNVYVPADLCNGKKGRLLIKPDGWTYVQYPGDSTSLGDAQCFVSLDGVQFGI